MGLNKGLWFAIPCFGKILSKELAAVLILIVGMECQSRPGSF